MPWFEIIYSDDVSGKALALDKVVARDRKDAAVAAMSGFAKAKAERGAKCFRILDGLGMVVARGPK
jgi:hypothetical protein